MIRQFRLFMRTPNIVAARVKSKNRGGSAGESRPAAKR
jgi:hypothetical protein